jgi:hypothetical protein
MAAKRQTGRTGSRLVRTAAKKGTPRKRPGSKQDCDLCINWTAEVKQQLGPRLMGSTKGKELIDLKKGSVSVGELSELLRRVGKRRVGFIILNAPFRVLPGKSAL